MRRSPSRGSAASLSIAHRNDASVFPDPVGAEIRTCSPDAIAGYAWAWAGVGCANAPMNQSRVAALKSDRGMHLRLRRIHEGDRRTEASF